MRMLDCFVFQKHLCIASELSLGPHHFCFKDVGNGVGLALGFKELVLHNYTANQA